MKKMLIAFVACVCFAGIASAAQINWGTGVFVVGGKPGDVANPYRASTAYCFSSSLGRNALSELIAGGSFNSSGTDDYTVWGTKESDPQRGSFVAGVHTDPGGSLVEQVFYIVIFDNATGEYKLSLVGNDMTPSDETLTGIGAQVPPKWTAMPDSFSDWSTVVPEPTSMALLMLGVAALGLRRKVRA